MKEKNINERLEATLILKKLLDGTLKNEYDKLSAFQNSLLGITLRRLGEIQIHLKKYIKTPIQNNKTIVKSIIYLASAQIIYMRTPAYAAVNVAVEIAKKLSPAHSKFTNAILRKLVLDVENNNLTTLDPICNIPELFQKKWNNFLDIDQIKKISEQLLIIPPALDTFVKYSKDQKTIERKLNGILIDKNCVRIKNPKGKITNYYGFKEGKWWVQDIAAQLPCKILIKSLKKNANIIDLCAAPGGKTAQLLSYGVNVISLEKNYGRAKILGSNLARLKLNAQIINKDAILWKPPKLANAVIIDAPCSATGTIRKNPDILWKMVFNQEKTKEKIKLLLKLQKKLLLSASHMIGTNGILIYSVCSLEPEEGQEQINNFLNINKNFKIIPIKPEDIDIPIDAITKEGFLQTLPFMFSNKGGMDSFFVARLKKNH